MLSELYHLSKNLAKGEAEANLVHENFDSQPGLTTNINLHLTLGPNGSIVKLAMLEHIDTKGENHLALWTLKKGNFKYFPATRVKQPLCSIPPNAEIWNTLKKSTSDGLLTFLSSENICYSLKFNGGEREQAERISRWQHEEEEPISALHEFSHSFLELTKDTKLFAQSLRELILSELRKGSNPKLEKAFQTLACGSLKESKGKAPKIECKVQIIFDYQPRGALSGVLYSPMVQRVVLECLNREKPPSKKKKKNAAEDGELKCAFEPDDPMANRMLDTPYPDWSVKPVIGKTFKPYSKFSDAPCNFRYGHADTSGFPVGVETAKTIIGFASSLTTESLRGIIWQGIRNGKFDVRGGKKIETFDALIAYPSFSWDALAPVSIFTRPFRKEVETNDPDDEDNIVPSGQLTTGFKQVAESYVRSLKERVPESARNTNNVHLLLLRAISPGQVQLVYSASPTCVEFDAAIAHWIASESYLPKRLMIPLPSKKAEKGLGWFRPHVLFPDEATQVFTHQWKREGTDSHRIQAPSVGDIFNVFLRRDGVWEQSARELLDTLLPRVESLLIAAGQRIHLTDKTNLTEWHDFVPLTAQGQPDRTKPDPRYSLAQALSLLGTLLHSLHSHKTQHYMKETAYQLGRLLAAFDHLHKCYCDAERDGSYPPTLIGNGLLGRAADSPKDALDELRERSRIYLGWAKISKPKPLAEGISEEKAKPIKRQRNAVYRARELFEFIDPICRDIHANSNLSDPLNTEDKAHLFLGYLTEVPRKKWEDTNQSTKTESTIED